MLPIFRIVPVGGVFLAILILILALTPPDGARTPSSQRMVGARGPLIDRDEHPEWRQLLIRAAFQRADELNRLRELPDTPMRIAPPAPAESKAQSETPEAPAPETQAASEPETQAKPKPETQAAPEPETPSEPSALAPSKPSGGSSAAHIDSEPTNTPPEIAQPAAPASVQPAALESVNAEPPAPAQPAAVESANAAPPAPLQPPMAEPAPPEAPAPAPAAIADVPKQPENGPPADRNGSDPAPGEAPRLVDATPGAAAASEMTAALPAELPVMLPEKRPAAADVTEPVKPAQTKRRTPMRKAKLAQPAKALTFFDLLFGSAEIQETPAPASQPSTQPSAPKKTTTSDVTVFRDVSATVH